MSVFGVLSDSGHGHVVTTLLIAMVAMLFTAFSYGRMARAYPSAGSAFTYVGQEINPALGYVTGWSMVMDYILNPMICIIWCSQQALFLRREFHTGDGRSFLALCSRCLNLQGIKTSARVNTALAAGMGVVVAIFFVVAARYIMGNPHDGSSFFTRPFYDPQLWNSKAVLGATSIAVLSYIGFDGISTLSEEAENPRRNILLATVLTCFVIGILSALEVYAAQLVWPATQPFPEQRYGVYVRRGRAWKPMFAISGLRCWSRTSDQAWARRSAPRACCTGWDAARLFRRSSSERSMPSGMCRATMSCLSAASLWLGRCLVSFNLFSYGLELRCLTSAPSSHSWASILRHICAITCAKGRHNAIPPFVLTALVIGLVLWPSADWHLLAAAGVALAILAVWAPPLAGFTICFFLWKNLSWKAWIVGGIWMAVGIAFGAWKTHGFRGDLVNFDLPPEEE